jgi:hypothetical protein
MRSWKKAQKKPKKKNNSEIINKITPYRSPSCTIFVWCPSKVASLITSRHQQPKQQIKKNKPKLKSKPPLLNECIYNTPPKTKIKSDNDVKKGQGLESTKW